MRSVGQLRWIFILLALGTVAAPANACTTLMPSSPEEAQRWRQDRVDGLADRLIEATSDSEVIFIGRVTAIRDTGMAEVLGGPVRLGWEEVPAVRVWLEPMQPLRGAVPPVFSIYEGRWGDYCDSGSSYSEGQTVLVAAERRYAGGHWFGEIIGEKDLPDLLPALAKRGLKIEMSVR